MTIEFENSPPMIKNVPQLELKLFAKSLVAAVKKFKIQEEVKQCQEQPK